MQDGEQTVQTEPVHDESCPHQWSSPIPVIIPSVKPAQPRLLLASRLLLPSDRLLLPSPVGMFMARPP